jgi:formylmethanofuran dehydrogenase subunit A
LELILLLEISLTWERGYTEIVMQLDLIKISGGTVYDPANGIDGEVRDLWIASGKVVAAPTDPKLRPTRTIDAAGLVVMPGGIDMHCHIAGPKVNAARKLRPESNRSAEPMLRTPLTRSGTLGSVPSTFATGYKYAALGYTTAFDAAVPPLLAAHAHEEFADTPCLDKGCYLLMGNNHYIMRAIQKNEPAKLRAFIAWLLAAGKGYAPKLVNPGGVEAWKLASGSRSTGLDDSVPHFDVTPRQIILSVAQAAHELKLPHPVHIHCNQLGMPGNWRTTLETMQALEDRRGHLTHIQFHSYGGGEADEGTFVSKVPQLADYVNTHDNVTVDVGQVMFGETTSMTGDGPLGHFLANLYGTKWLSCDVEMEAGCGVSPIIYKNKSLVHSLQWAIGLEWYLLVDDPWRVVMSTDHPNGGSFLAYPQIIRLLMDRTFRGDMLKSCPPSLASRTSLADLQREYTLNEIAIITRAGPARILGLTNKGHLGTGADADITIYTPHENKELMFELPRLVMKGGEIIVEQGEIRSAPQGNILNVKREYDREVEPDIQAWFEENYSVSWRNYGVDNPTAASAS